MRAGDEERKRRSGLDLFDADGNDRLLLVDGGGKLLRHEVRTVAGLREHEDEGGARLDAPDDLVAEIASGLDVARRDPARDAAGFEGAGDGLRLFGVCLGVADKG